MNLTRWKERFYYTNTPDPTKHCILLFEGLKSYDMWNHWLTKWDNDSKLYATPSARPLKEQNHLMFDVNSHHCWVDLAKYETEYIHWVNIGDPLPMLNALKKTLKERPNEK